MLLFFSCFLNSLFPGIPTYWFCSGSSSSVCVQGNEQLIDSEGKRAKTMPVLCIQASPEILTHQVVKKEKEATLLV